MLIKLLLCIDAIAFSVAAWLIIEWMQSKKQTGMRLKRIINNDNESNENQIENIIAGMFTKLVQTAAAYAARFTPRQSLETTRARLQRAGFWRDSSITMFIGINLICSISVGALVFVACVSLHFNISKNLVVSLAAAILCRTLFNFMLDKSIAKRHAKLGQELPDAIDLITVCVEAGLGLDAALIHVVEKNRGPIAEEFGRLLRDIRLGRLRKDALKDMAERNDYDDLTALVSTLIQSEQLGTSLGQTMRLHSGRMREKQRQLAEEKARKAPVKMIFPMVLAIFPFMFIILLGPAVIRIMKMY